MADRIPQIAILRSKFLKNSDLTLYLMINRNYEHINIGPFNKENDEKDP